MSKQIAFLTGMDGQVELLEDRVIIHRPGIWNAIKFGFNATREIPLTGLSEIGFKPAGAFFFGEIEFVTGTKHSNVGGKGMLKKKSNPNAIKFKKDKTANFKALKEKVFEMMQQQKIQR